MPIIRTDGRDRTRFSSQPGSFPSAPPLFFHLLTHSEADNRSTTPAPGQHAALMRTKHLGRFTAADF